jgi:ribulose-phosphate 3-epimerase
MRFHLGIKSDPIEHRYSFEWLFALMDRLDVRFMQMGSFPGVFTAEDGYFEEVRESAEKCGIRIKSCFTTHRDLGGWMTGNRYLERASLRNYRRYIHVTHLLGADHVGGNAGSVYLDNMEFKGNGIERYIANMKELMAYAKEKGLKALNLEPMSCTSEPPSYPDEIEYIMTALYDYHTARPDTTVPVFLCSDIGHGIADKNRRVIHDNMELFEMQIPWMSEFHIKNTDSSFDATFGFTKGEYQRGIIDLRQLRSMIDRNWGRWPVEELVGYLEISGPKTGRDYSDYLLEEMIVGSVETLKKELLYK